LLKIVKKTEVTGVRAVIYRLIAIVGALMFGSLIMMFMGYNPIDIFFKIVEGSVSTQSRIIQTLKKAIPLIILSLGISMYFKLRFWNIGAEGQFYMGAFGASFVALSFGDLPPYILIPMMMLVAVIMGGFWAIITAVLKYRIGVSETLISLMMNYIAIEWISYLQHSLWKDPNSYGFAKIARFSENAVLPTVFGLHAGWIIALLLVIAVLFIFNYTKLGFEISVFGENTNTARYAGMNIKKILYITVFLGGGICGIAGMVEASAVEKSLSYQLSSGLGFTAVITAWLAKFKPWAVVVTSLLFSMLLRGGEYIQVNMQVPSSLADILQGVILMFVLASEFFLRYKIVRTNSHSGISQQAEEVEIHE
jgi:ABC-type uncharacterized transport system permease subunit